MNRVLAHLALLIVAITYGGNYLVAKGLMPDLIGPSGFIVLRVVGGGAMFWVVRALMRLKGDWESIDRSDWGRLFLCGTTGVAVNQLLFFNGLSATSPVNASIIMTINPILVLGSGFAPYSDYRTQIDRHRHWRGRCCCVARVQRESTQFARFVARRLDDSDQCH
jgi:drug/metabolite transporter (DMT)-like permease